MEQKMFTVSIDKEFDVMNKEFSNSIYLRVYTSLFQVGIVKDLKPTNFTVLLAVASFMDAEGNCFPTQRQISEITGLSKTTVNKAINELLQYKVNDNPILKRELVQVGQFKNSYYTVNPISQIAIFEGQVQEIEPSSVSDSKTEPVKELVLNKNQETISNNNNSDEQELTFRIANDVSAYFAKIYRETYGVDYSINFRRDNSIIKKKWIGKYTDNQIKTMVEYSIREYESRWKNARFPRPTIPAMVSWIGEQALAIAEDSSKEFEELTEMTAGAADETEDVLKKFGIGGGE